MISLGALEAQIAEYQRNHPEVRKKAAAKSYPKRAAKRSELVTCECGAVVCAGALNHHKKSPKHSKLMELRRPNEVVVNDVPVAVDSEPVAHGVMRDVVVVPSDQMI